MNLFPEWNKLCASICIRIVSFGLFALCIYFPEHVEIYGQVFDHVVIQAYM